MHVYSRHGAKEAKRLLSESGRTFFLRHPDDSGSSAYQVVIPAEYSSDRVRKYRPREPSGSCADIRAKGVWSDGAWTVELGRRLGTGHLDGMQFHPGGVYLFGVSRHEIAARKPAPRIDKVGIEM